ncbi:hypothetical protein DDP54_02360 [Cellulomonas sp. WB94]|nr:hypothetical protein DDP54_02360 [Cellulomonas sp. WB94]
MAVAMLPLFVAAAVRAVLVGVVVTDREVVVRSFVRTRRIGRDEVVEVRLKNYDKDSLRGTPRAAPWQ